jgi:hypothetical protein
MNRLFLISTFALSTTLAAPAFAAPPAHASAGGLPACERELTAAEDDAALLLAELAAAEAEIAALQREVEALRATSVSPESALADVVALLPKGGGADLDRAALDALGKSLGALADAAVSLGLEGAVLQIGSDKVTLHLVSADAERRQRNGGTMSFEAGGTMTAKAPKIDLNP